MSFWQEVFITTFLEYVSARENKKPNLDMYEKRLEAVILNMKEKVS